PAEAKAPGRAPTSGEHGRNRPNRAAGPAATARPKKNFQRGRAVQPGPPSVPSLSPRRGMNIFSFRVRFSKTGKLRFLSHHDLMRLFERALRRTGMPLRMTEGYNPHPVLSFPTALGLGIESLDEVLEFELTSWTAPRQIEKLLGEQLPEGIRVASAEAF